MLLSPKETCVVLYVFKPPGNCNTHMQWDLPFLSFQAVFLLSDSMAFWEPTLRILPMLSETRHVWGTSGIPIFLFFWTLKAAFPENVLLWWSHLPPEFTYGQSVPSLKLPKPSSFHHCFCYCFDKCLLHFNFHPPIHNPLSNREAAGTSMLVCLSIKIRVGFGENDQGALTLLNLKSLGRKRNYIYADTTS